MPIIDYYPTSHRAVEFAVATTMVNGSVTALRVVLRAVGSISDPLLFVTDNNLGQEILSKAGLEEELPVLFDSGVLEDSSQPGSYFLYELSYPVETVQCS